MEVPALTRDHHEFQDLLHRQMSILYGVSNVFGLSEDVNSSFVDYRARGHF